MARRWRTIARLGSVVLLAVLAFPAGGSAAQQALLPRSVTIYANSHTIHRGEWLTLRGLYVFGLSWTGCGGGPCPPPPIAPPPVIFGRHDRGHPFVRFSRLQAPMVGLDSEHFSWSLRVRPQRDTIYIAEAKGAPGIWQTAFSRPFKVVVAAQR